MTNVHTQIQQQHPGADVSTMLLDEKGPYIAYEVVIRKRVFTFNPDYVATKPCYCGHSYERHFDPYEDNAAVGCKYCECRHYAPNDGHLTLYERCAQHGNTRENLQDYITQWEMFGSFLGQSLEEHLGAPFSKFDALNQYLDLS